jgi:hypothetical protein
MGTQRYTGSHTPSPRIKAGIKLAFVCSVGFVLMLVLLVLDCVGSGLMAVAAQIRRLKMRMTQEEWGYLVLFVGLVIILLIAIAAR